MAIPVVRCGMLKHGCFVLLLLAACGNGTEETPDADPGNTAIDAMIPVVADAQPAEPDAFNPCPGRTTLEMGVVDWQTGENLPDVQVVQEEGDTAMSAPNGRVVLCVKEGEITLRLTKSGYADRVHSTNSDVVSQFYTAGVAPVFRMPTVAAQAEMFASGGVIGQRSKTIAITLTTEVSGTPLADVQIAMDLANEGSFHSTNPGTDLTAATRTDSDGRLLFLNAELGQAALNVTSATGNCRAPDFLLEAGVSSVSIVCE